MKKTKLVLPMLAGILAVSVYVANAKQDASNKNGKLNTSQEWMFNGTDQTAPGDYIEVPNGSTENCSGSLKVCVVSAPEDANGQPDFSAVTGLETALENNTSHPNITRGDYTNP